MLTFNTHNSLQLEALGILMDEAAQHMKKVAEAELEVFVEGYGLS